MESKTGESEPHQMVSLDHDYEESLLHPFISKKLVCLIATTFVGLCVTQILIGKQLWPISVGLSESLSSGPAWLYYYFWLFSNPFFDISYVFMAIVLILAPKKDSALKSIFIFTSSHWIRQILKTSVKEGRPIFEANGIVSRAGCSCSFGFPSGHSEGSAMLYALLVYDLVVQKKAVSRKVKFAWVMAAIFMVFNIMVSRLYFGKHSMAQVTIGCFEGMTSFCVGIMLERELDGLFMRLLNGDKQAFLFSLSMYASLGCLSFILWFFVFEDQLIRFNGFSPARCKTCFNHQLLLIRLGTVKGLAHPFIGAGLISGIGLLSPSYRHRDSPDLPTITIKSVIKVCLMSLCHFPLVFMHFHLTSNTALELIIASMLFFIAGFTSSWGTAKLSNCLKLTEETDFWYVEGQDAKIRSANEKDSKNEAGEAVIHKTAKIEGGKSGIEVDEVTSLI